MNKYKNRKTKVDNIVFASAKESRRYLELKLLQKAGEISDLELQPSFRIEINGDLICTYKGDFFYRDKQGLPVTEDCKGFLTPIYRLKKKLVKAVLGVEIRET